MTRARKLIAVTLTTAGLAFLASGCGDSVVGGQPPVPGVAAQVEDTTLKLDEVDLLTDAVCESIAQDPTSRATSRALVQEGVVAQWVTAEAARAIAEEEDVTVESPPVDYRTIPGWDGFSEDQQEAVKGYVDAIQYLQAALPEVGGEQGQLDMSGVDVTINPRFDLAADETLAVADRQTSVAVSAEALAGTADELSDEQLADLPDSQLCGTRAEPGEASPPPPGM